jgi:hypothetical protein
MPLPEKSRPFMRREAVLSSRFEGTQASLFDLCAYKAVQLAMFEPPSVEKDRVFDELKGTAPHFCQE